MATATAPLPPLPRPEQQPTMSIPDAGRYLGLGHAASYNAARRGVIPTLQLSPHRRVVATAELRRLLGIDPIGAGADPVDDAEDAGRPL